MKYSNVPVISLNNIFKKARHLLLAAYFVDKMWGKFLETQLKPINEKNNLKLGGEETDQP